MHKFNIAMKFEEAIQKIQYGKCLLLTGAGFSLGAKITSKINLIFVLQNILHMNYTTNVIKKIKMTIYVRPMVYSTVWRR